MLLFFTMTSADTAPNHPPHDESPPAKAKESQRTRPHREHRDRVLRNLFDVTDASALGRQVHPGESGVPGTYYVNQRRPGPWDWDAFWIRLTDATGTVRSATMFREGVTEKWLTVETGQPLRGSWFEKDVYDFLMASHPRIADSAQESTELWLLHYGVLPTTIANTFHARRAMQRLASGSIRWAAAFDTQYGRICAGCQVCAEAPEWFVHRVIEMEC